MTPRPCYSSSRRTEPSRRVDEEMKFRHRTIKSTKELLVALGRLRDTEPIWFRGQPAADWALVPSIARGDDRSTLLTIEQSLEHRLAGHFKQNALRMVEERPMGEWEWLFLMRHHGVPSRLLDWSESPLTALYFAAQSMDGVSVDGAIWVLWPRALNALSNLTAPGIPSFLEDEEALRNYHPDVISKGHPPGLGPVAGLAPRNSARMQAQLGVFSIHELTMTPIEKLKDPNGRVQHVGKYIVPSAAKETILQELADIGVTRLSLFPDLDSAALVARKAVSGG